MKNISSNEIINAEAKSTFLDSGLLIQKEFFSPKLIESLVITFYQRLCMQAYKLRILDKIPEEDFVPQITDIDRLVVEINAKSKAALDFVVQSLRETKAAFSVMADDKFITSSSELLECPISLLKMHMDGILINLPNNQTRLYKFHSEQHYYPQRRNFLTFWMPIIREKTENNGAMVVKLGGHKINHTFIEYTGFNAKESNGVSEENFFHQLQIPNEDISMFKDMTCNFAPNTAVFFHQNLPHTSSINISSQVSYSLIIRVYDYRFDPTLSDVTGVKSYTEAAARGGFPDLRPFHSN